MSDLRKVIERADGEWNDATGDGPLCADFVENLTRAVQAWNDEALADAEKRGAVKALRKLSDEIDEDQRYMGSDVIVWIFGIVNALQIGVVTL